MTPSLTRLSLQGAAWSMFAFGGAQMLRLVSSLILTRLLMPEYFGLMALVNVFMIGVSMFSDVGLGPNIVQSARGNERPFLNTAWTVQIMRGLAIWLICLLGAWPFATFYDDSRLMPLVAVSGLAAVISGFNSTKLLTAYRDLSLGRVTAIELVTQVLSVLFTVAFAALQASVWALVFASLFSAFMKMLASHWFLSGANNRISFDADCMRELVRFGRWIFIGTIISFTANSAASLILGKFLSATDVGIFSLAVTLANVCGQAYEQVSSKVIFPVYARIKNLSLADLRQRVRKVRLVVALAFLPLLWLMTIFGAAVLRLLLDPRYHSGGWIVQVFSACTLPAIISAAGPLYLAMGNSFLSMQLAAAKLALYLLCAAFGWWFAGPTGIIVGMAGHSWLAYLLDVSVQRRYGIWMPRLDLSMLTLSALVIALGLRLTGQL
jgi:O-antigen/teichoic acid export membrane protein